MIKVSVFLLLLVLPTQALPAENRVDPHSGSNADPWEDVNRKIFRFNQGFDRIFLKPLATHSEDLLPRPVTTGVKNFFANLGDVGIAINNLLQGKFRHALTDGGRVVVNSTLGLAGLFDVASLMKLEKHYEDFGQTLGKWGVPSGPYLVLPLFGPASVRDGVGFLGDLAVDPVMYAPEVEIVVGLFVVRAVSLRSDLLVVTDIIEQAALDPYAFQRDTWLQKREFDIRDGSFEDEDF
ncbi:MAG: VacJ family lipoprotein [Pseudomonadota bacterium]